MQNENARLNLQVITLKAGEQRVKSLEAENKQLLSLLRETETMSDQFLGAQLLSVNTSDYTDEIVINKGGSEHVTLGQSVIDSSGLMGQVIQVWPNTSRVLLITDRRSAVPVQVQRNGLRAIALGNGQQGLRIENLLKTADIQAGDILVTSGLGKRFPKGYPVGKVTRVLQNEGSQFLAVSIAPLAAIDRSQEVLLISAGGQHA